MSKPNLLFAINDGLHSILADTNAAIVPGQIYAVNEARLQASTFSEPLTAYSVGWRDSEGIADTLEWLCPSVPVARRFEFKKGKPDEPFFSDVDDVRAIGAAFKTVQMSGTSVNEKTQNKGLMYRIDRDEDLVDEQSVVASLQQRLLRNELRRALSVADAAATNSAKTWDNTKQPDEDMRAAVAAHQLATGVFPNRALIGLAAWNLRAGAYATQNNAGAAASYGRTPKQVAELLGLDDMRTSRELFQVSAAAKQRVMSSSVLFYYGQSNLMKDDPSAVKRFVTRMDGAGPFRVLRKEDGKFIDIIVEHYSTIVAAAGGLQKLTIS